MRVRTESKRVINEVEYSMIVKALEVACDFWKKGCEYSNTWVYVASEDITENDVIVRNAFEVSINRDDIDKPADKYSVNELGSLVLTNLCQTI